MKPYQLLQAKTTSGFRQSPAQWRKGSAWDAGECVARKPTFPAAFSSRPTGSGLATRGEGLGRGPPGGSSVAVSWSLSAVSAETSGFQRGSSVAKLVAKAGKSETSGRWPRTYSAWPGSFFQQFHGIRGGAAVHWQRRSAMGPTAILYRSRGQGLSHARPQEAARKSWERRCAF